MRAATLGLAALSHSAASAFLIPSTNSAPEITDIDKLNFNTVGVDPRTRLFKAPCAGCKFGQKDLSSPDRVIWTEGVENALVLNVSVGADQVGTLELNGVRFYPPLMNFAAVENPVPYIPQVSADMPLVAIVEDMDELAKKALRLTAWSFQAGSSSTVDENGDELLTIHLQLDALEREPINVPDVAITVLKTVEGELSIVKVDMQDKEEAEKEECAMWPAMCKLKEMLNKLSGMKPHFGGFGSLGKPADCDGGANMEGVVGKTANGTPIDANGDWIPGSSIPPWISGDKSYEGWRPGQGTPPPWIQHGFKGHHGPPGDHPHGPPGGHHGGHKGWKGHGPPPWAGKHGHGGFHRAMHIFARVMLTVFIPILIGIAAGMITYLLGLIVGAAVVAIYMKIRGRRTKYQAVALEDEVAEFEIDDDETPRNSFDEKDELLEAPPIYVEKE